MSYRLEIGTALLLAVAIVIGIWAANRKARTPDLDFRTSTYLNGPRGSKALHEVLTRLGRLSARRRTPLSTLATERAHRPAILVLVNPVIDLRDAELEQVTRYVRAGGAVVAVGDGGGVTACTGWRTQSGGIGNIDTIGVRSLETQVRLPPTGEVLTARTSGTSGRGRLEKLRKGGAESSESDACNTLVPFAVDTVVVALNNRPAILRLRYRGGGTITLVADPAWFTNRAWRDTDVPIALLPLLTPRPERPGRVVWDEYHQGFGEGDQGSVFERTSARTWAWLRSNPAGWAILQLIAVALAWLAMTSVRFGPAVSVIERRRRSPLEHLEALGAGLESAADTDTAIKRLALGLRRRLSRAGYAGDGNVLPWLESLELAMRGPQGRAAVRRLHHLLTARAHDEQRVLLAAQAVEDVWEELRPRTTRNAS